MGTPTTVPTGLSGVLFAKTQRRVLGLLFGNPDRSFFANEIVRLADSGIGAVQRELAALESVGLVSARRVGNQKHYQANRASPIFEELRGIVVKTFGIADVLREVLAPLAARIRGAFVYGSVAKRTDTASSDVDLLVISDDVSYSDLFGLLATAEQRLGRKVNPTVYKSSELRKKLSAENAFATRVLAQPKIFIIGSEDDLRTPRTARKGKTAQGRAAGPKGV
jgi:predicted nucleotidyltransferase